MSRRQPLIAELVREAALEGAREDCPTRLL